MVVGVVGLEGASAFGRNLLVEQDDAEQELQPEAEHDVFLHQLNYHLPIAAVCLHMSRVVVSVQSHSLQNFLDSEGLFRFCHCCARVKTLKC